MSNQQPNFDPNMMQQLFALMSQMKQNVPQTNVLGEEIVEEKGLHADIIRPALIDRLIIQQKGISTGTILDRLFLDDDGNPIGGLPIGATTVYFDRPQRTKTRTGLKIACEWAAQGNKVMLVTSEDIYHDKTDQRNDLHSRLCKIGLQSLNLEKEEFREKVLENIYIVERPYYASIKENELQNTNYEIFMEMFYKPLIEEQGIRFCVCDSLTALDPVNKRKTADNLNALKTYNQQYSVTCLIIAQVASDGDVQGGNPLLHNAEVTIKGVEKSIGSKDEAAEWNAKYHEHVDCIVVSSKVCKTVQGLIRVGASNIGTLELHPDHPHTLVPIPELK